MEGGCFGCVYPCHGYVMFVLRWMCGMFIGILTKRVSLVWGCRQCYEPRPTYGLNETL